MTLDGHTVTLAREPRTGEDGKAYTVLLDGARAGEVYQAMVTHDRAPRGSRIATSRSRSLRWFSRPGGYGWSDHRYEAIATVLAAKLGGNPADHHTLARTARQPANGVSS